MRGSRQDRNRTNQDQNLSTLDRRYYKSPERDNYRSPERDNYRSPERSCPREVRDTHSPSTSTPVSYRSSRRTRNREEVREDFVAMTTGQSEAGNQGNMLGNNLAQQLQQIVRGELRRMMEVIYQRIMGLHACM